MGIVKFTIGQYTVSATVGEAPSTYDSLCQHARSHDDLGLLGTDRTALVVTVSSSSHAWPELVIALRFSPGPEAGFNPGIVVIPEHDLLLLGAGETLLAYELTAPRRLWADAADTGFWGWQRHGDVLVMSAELEVAAWDVRGKKLWSAFVEPPWDYQVKGDAVTLDVMGKKTCFALRSGPVGSS